MIRPATLLLLPLVASAATVEVSETADFEFDDPSTEYVVYGRHERMADSVNGNHLVVPAGSSSEANPIRITLDRVAITQENRNPKKSFLTVEKNNYVVVRLLGDNYVRAWSHDEFGSDDGMAGLHVAAGATLKVTSADGDGSTNGTLSVRGGGGKYGGAGIGTRYNEDAGTIVVAGGTIRAWGGHCAAGIGSGRDGKATEIRIEGGNVYAEGGEYAAGIGAGDHVGAGEGGDLVNLTVSGGTVVAVGGANGAGIGCSEGGDLHGTITIRNANVRATGGTDAAGIGGADGTTFRGGSGGIVVESGTIVATGGKNGAGIGGGNANEGVAVAIRQTRGAELSVDATGGSGGAGIGSGAYKKCKGVEIRLAGGTVVAHGGGGAAGVGAGFEMGTIDISGTGTIEAYGGKNGAGIGAGNDGEQCGEIRIRGDTDGSPVTRGAASGAGCRGLSITAVASYGRVEEGDGYSYENEAAAIGSGKATCADITVENAVLRTKADCQGADIGGGGYHVTAGGTIGNISIANCEIRSSSVHKVAPGIGSGYGGTVDHITIKDTLYSGGGIGGAPMDINYRGLNTVKSIEIENSDVTAVWDETSPGKFVGGWDWMGTPLDHSAAGIGSGQYGSMDSIAIKDSKVVAGGYGSGAGIGGGGSGGNGFTLLDLKKWDIGDVGTIEISGSDVEASSGTATFDEHTPIQLYDGTVFYQIDNPKMLGGGAGIGSGNSSGVKKIHIRDCGTIVAKGDGAGIGAGCGSGNVVSGWVDYLWIENVDSVYASGGKWCAGIGVGGGDGIRTSDSGALRQIYIADCRDLKAYGGEGGAGIGLGKGNPCYYHIAATEKGDWPIEIRDSTVYAKGGDSAAGIGGGFEEPTTHLGGENPRTRIAGKSRVNAIGGDALYFEAGNGRHGGGAGIGGGSDGACSVVEIDLDETADTPLGTYENPELSGWYVRATGTDGGAGIGCGGNSWQIRSNVIHNDADGGTVIVDKGAVFARGGDSAWSAREGHVRYDEYYRTGSGAGIGGGSAGSILDDVLIKGGYVVAIHGKNDRGLTDLAWDIGAGGDWAILDTGRNPRRCDVLRITDGTVLADDIGGFSDERRVSGGSVRGIVTDATESESTSGTKVYRTRLKLAAGPGAKATVKTSKSYNSKHVWADPDGWLWLYLREAGDAENHAQWADVTVDGTTLHYVGYTDTKHGGILKLEGEELPLAVSPDPVHAGEDFRASVDDAAERYAGCAWTFSVEGAASRTGAGDVEVSPGASWNLHADAPGTATLVATCPAASDPDLYWGSTARAEVPILAPVPTVALVGLLEKTYDALPAEPPAVETPSDGAVSFDWFDADGAPLAAAPVHVGSYFVRARVAATESWAAAESERAAYAIRPAPVALSQSGSRGGAGEAGVTAEARGLFELPDGARAFFTVYAGESETPISGWDAREAVLREEGGRYLATVEGDWVAAGTYRVAVTGAFGGDYAEPAPCERLYDKDLAARTVSAADVAAAYGDAPVALVASASAPTDGDRYSFRIESDSAALLAEAAGVPAEPTIELVPRAGAEGGNAVDVRILHAGTAVVRISLADGTGVYDDAETLATVTVAPAPLAVRSYAYAADDGTKTPVSAVAYGKTGALAYDLLYEGLLGDDSPTNFTRGFGTLAPVPLPAGLGASATPHPIGIDEVGAEIATGGVTRTVFFSRDYEIALDTATHAVTVEKATLAVRACDAACVYGEAAPEFAWEIADRPGVDDGLAPWDAPGDVFAAGAGPRVSVDSSKTGGEDFPEIGAGTYAEALAVADGDGGDSPNYDVSYLTGTLVVEPADIGDADRFEVPLEGASVGYDARPHEADIVDTAFDGGRALAVGTDVARRTLDGTNAADAVHAATLTAVFVGEGNYTGVRRARYTIAPCPLPVSTESAEKVYDGTPLTAGGTAGDVFPADAGKVRFSTTGSQTETGSSANTYEVSFADEATARSYVVEEESVGTLLVTPRPGAISFAGSPEKVYDARPAVAPDVVTEGTGPVSIRWCDATGAPLDAAPVDAGSYLVVAEQAADRNHGACSAELAFEIRPAPATVHVELDVAADGTNATVFAVVEGLFGEDGNVAFTVGWSKDGDSRELADGVSRPVERLSDGRFVASLPCAGLLPAGLYSVRAVYRSESGNYRDSEAEAAFDKALRERAIDVVTHWAKTYGDGAFFLGASASGDLAGPDDVWDFRVEYDSFSEYGAEAAVAVENDGSVEVRHAGRSVILVRLEDGAGVYAPAEARVEVVVAQAPLAVTAFAARPDGVRTNEAVYGTVGSLSYGLDFDGLVNGDTPETFTHGYGTLEAVGPDARADAAATPYPVSVVRCGAAAAAGGTEGPGPFVSRDYDLAAEDGSVRILRADIGDAARFSVAEPADVFADGTEQKLECTVTDGLLAAVLAPGEDVAVSYPGRTEFASPGPVVAVFVGRGNYTGTTNGSYRILVDTSDLEATLRWKYAKNANGWHCAQVAIVWREDYAGAIEDMRLLFSDRTDAQGRLSAYLVDPATVTNALDATEEYEGLVYRAAAIDLGPFAELPDGARAVYGVGDATLADAYDRVPRDERKICLRVVDRDLGTVEPVSNKLACLAWTVAGRPYFLPIAEAVFARRPDVAQPPAPRPLTASEANLSASFGLSAAAVARGAVTCRVSSMSIGADGSVEGTFEIAAEDAAGVVAESGELAGNVKLTVLGAESLGGSFEPIDPSCGAELLSRTPPYAFRVKAPGKNAFFKIHLASEDFFE
jgi:hypothetical protein